MCCLSACFSLGCVSSILPWWRTSQAGGLCGCLQARCLAKGYHTIMVACDRQEVCMGACRRGVWRMAGRSLARPRTSACWRSSARGCAPCAPSRNALAVPGVLFAHSSQLAVPLRSWHTAGCAMHSVLRVHISGWTAGARVWRALACSCVTGSSKFLPKPQTLPCWHALTGAAARAAQPVPQNGLAGRAAVPHGCLAALCQQRGRA